MKMLSRHGKPLKGSKVLLLGVAYKRDIDDMRESPAMEILRQLVKQGADVRVNDPHIPSFHLDGQIYESESLSAELLEEADITVITTDHSAYRLSFDRGEGPVDFRYP